MIKPLLIAAALGVASGSLLTKGYISWQEEVEYEERMQAREARIKAKFGSSQDESHNEAGGYIEACGSLPGVLGDDC